MKASDRRWLFVALAIFFVVLTPVVWVGAVYASSDSFEDWVAEHPIGEFDIESLGIPRGEVVATGNSLVWPPDFASSDEDRQGTWSPTVRIEHAGDVLLDLELEVRIITDKRVDAEQSEEFRGLVVKVARTGLHSDFHGRAVLSVKELERYVDEDTPRGRLRLDVMLLSGPGDFQLDLSTWEEGVTPASVELKPLGGIRLPWSGPPDEGLILHAYGEMHPTWEKTERGSTGLGLGFWQFFANTNCYSMRFEGKHVGAEPWNAGAPTTSTAIVDRSYSWGGDDW